MNVHLGTLHVSAIGFAREPGFLQNQGHLRNPNPYPMQKSRITVSTGIALIHVPNDSTTMTLMATIAIRRIGLICHICVSGSCDCHSTVQLLECGDASSLRGETTCGPHTSLHITSCMIHRTGDATDTPNVINTFRHCTRQHDMYRDPIISRPIAALARRYMCMYSTRSGYRTVALQQRRYIRQKQSRSIPKIHYSRLLERIN